VASSIFLLDGAGVGNLGEVDDTGNNKGGDLWRRLQDDDEFSSDVDDEGRDDGNGHRSKRKKETDPEIEEAEREERESRQALIEVECALHDERARIDEAAKLSNARNQRLTQQRAQLQRHRKEVEEMEREIQLVKDDIVKENQLANSLEKGKD
jgi:TolA-binding protein